MRFNSLLVSTLVYIKIEMLALHSLNFFCTLTNKLLYSGRGCCGLVFSASDSGEGGPRFESSSRHLFLTNKPNVIRDFTFTPAEPGEDEKSIPDRQ